MNGPLTFVLAATWNFTVVLAGVVAVHESVVYVADEPVTDPLSLTGEIQFPEAA